MSVSRQLSAHGIALLIWAANPASVIAQESSTHQGPYEMLTVGNRAFGSLVASSQYELAIARITRHRADDPFAAANNLCVAFTMLGRFESAVSECNEAVKASMNTRAPKPRTLKGRAELTSAKALALSNRGVLRAVLGNTEGADQDFSKALGYATGLHALARNYTRLQNEVATTVAVVMDQ